MAEIYTEFLFYCSLDPIHRLAANYSSNRAFIGKRAFIGFKNSKQVIQDPFKSNNLLFKKRTASGRRAKKLESYT